MTNATPTSFLQTHDTSLPYTQQRHGAKLQIATAKKRKGKSFERKSKCTALQRLYQSEIALNYRLMAVQVQNDGKLPGKVRHV